MKHVSIIVCHYAQADDLGREREFCRMSAEKVKLLEEKGIDIKSYTRSLLMKVCLESILKNTEFPAELIVVDNGGNPDDSDYLVDLARQGKINTYIRNKNNMYFGWAWNQGAKLATGEYLLFTCNDIEFAPDWLSKIIYPLEKYPEKKLIATPLITPDKNIRKYNIGTLEDYRLNVLAGSNCMLMRKETFYEVGEFSTHSVAGTHWHKKMSRMGYTVVAPQEDYAFHTGFMGGYDFRKHIKVKKELINKEVIDYSAEYSI